MTLAGHFFASKHHCSSSLWIRLSRSSLSGDPLPLQSLFDFDGACNDFFWIT